MWAPKLERPEALKLEGEQFVDCIVNSKTTETDGRLGCRVVEVDRSRHQFHAWRANRLRAEYPEESIVIPFVDLKAQYLSIKDEVNAAIQGVLGPASSRSAAKAKFEEIAASGARSASA
jgi:hypothetical protein